MSSRKLSASIFTVGCLPTKRITGPDDHSITPTAITTAAIITPTRSAMPTAVITESRLNTRSSSRICTITRANDVPARPSVS